MKSDSINPLFLFFCFDCFWLLASPYEFYIKLLISTKNTYWDFDWNCIESLTILPYIHEYNILFIYLLLVHGIVFVNLIFVCSLLAYRSIVIFLLLITYPATLLNSLVLVGGFFFSILLDFQHWCTRCLWVKALLLFSFWSGCRLSFLLAVLQLASTSSMNLNISGEQTSLLLEKRFNVCVGIGFNLLPLTYYIWKILSKIFWLRFWESPNIICRLAKFLG